MSFIVTTCIAIGTSRSDCERDCAVTTTVCVSSAASAGSARKAVPPANAAARLRAMVVCLVLFMLFSLNCFFRTELFLDAQHVLGDGTAHVGIQMPLRRHGREV